MSPAAENHAEDHAENYAEGHAEGQPAGRGVEDHARARIVTDAPLSNPVPVALRYDPAGSPGAVCFAFPGDNEWTFPRDLLESGLRAPARRGDVEVWPCGRAQTVLEFHSPDGVAVVQFDNSPLVRFLRHTYATDARAAPHPAGTS